MSGEAGIREIRLEGQGGQLLSSPGCGGLLAWTKDMAMRIPRKE